MKTFSELEVGYWQGMERVPPSIVKQTIDVLDGFQRGGKLNLETADGVELLRNVIEYAESLLYTWVFNRLIDYMEDNGYSINDLTTVFTNRRPIDGSDFRLSDCEALQLYEAHTYEVQQLVTAEITNIQLLGRYFYDGWRNYNIEDPFALDENNQLILIDTALNILVAKALEEFDK